MAAPTILAVEDVEVALAWWQGVLGFTTSFVHRSPAAPEVLNYGVVVRDDVEIHLARRGELSDRRRAELTIAVADLDGLGNELAGREVPVARADRTLVVEDPTGNRVVFRQAAPVNR